MAATICAAAICFAALVNRAVGAEPGDRGKGGTGETSAPPWRLFNGVGLQGWKQNASGWRVLDGEICCGNAGDWRNILRFVAARIPANCEIEFEWREGATTNLGVTVGPAPQRLNPGRAISFAICGVDDDKPNSSYGAAIDYNVSGLTVRLHTRSLDDDSPRVGRVPVSGFGMDGPAKNSSNPIGQWNRSRIVCDGSKIQFWLNGNRAYDFTMKRDSTKGNHRDPAIEFPGSNLAIDDWNTRRALPDSGPSRRQGRPW